MPQVNFGRMIGYYTRDFRTGNVIAAVDYLTLLCLNADLPGSLGKSQASLCYEALRELVLESREFGLLLGDLTPDGIRVVGAIEQRLGLIGISDQEAFLRTVTLQAASIADDNGRTSDAVMLYHLAEDYDNVITIVNRALSDAIAVDIGQDDLRMQSLKPKTSSMTGEQQPAEGSSLSLTSVVDPAALAKNMITLYDRNALYYEKIRPTNRITCGVLQQISDAKIRVQNQQWAEALDVSLLPDIYRLCLLTSSLDNFLPEPPPPKRQFLRSPYPQRSFHRRHPPTHDITTYWPITPLDYDMHFSAA